MNTEEKEYDLIVYIGRFQPFHNAHQETIKIAADLAEHVLVLVGSAGGPRTIKNPWTYDERRYLIQKTAIDLGIDEQLRVRGVNDYLYDDNAWITEVGKIVNGHIKSYENPRIAVIGHDKDESSFYLNYFKQWKFIEVASYPQHSDSIDATKVRRLMFENDIEFVKGVVPKAVFDFLTLENVTGIPSFLRSAEFAVLKKEWEYVKSYKAAWAGAPYAPTFVTADALVIQSGQVLLVKRAGFPGQGLWALPGGFVDPAERVRATVLRELREETKLKVPVKVLDRAIDAYEMFDEPERSTRGRTITHAYRITLDPTQSLPKVKGDGSETWEAKWFSLSDLEDMEHVMFEDHYHIIKHMLAASARIVRA